MLAIFTPIVGFLLGPFALGGFLAGMIVVGQLLAVFMANAGGALGQRQEDHRGPARPWPTGKGSETHKASVTGDTVGYLLKDTAGPAINPLIKVMNMVSLLILPYVLLFGMVKVNEQKQEVFAPSTVGIVVLLVRWRPSPGRGGSWALRRRR